MIRLHTGAITLGLMSLATLGAGCNPFQSAQDTISQKIGESVVEGMVEGVSDGKVKMDAGSGQMLFTDNKTGDMMAFGENVKVPENFPADVPLYPGAAVVSLTMSAQESGTSVTLKSADAKSKVLAWYVDHMKTAGFTEDSSMTAGATEIRSYIKDTVKIALTVSAADTDAGSIVTLIRSQK